MYNMYIIHRIITIITFYTPMSIWHYKELLDNDTDITTQLEPVDFKISPVTNTQIGERKINLKREDLNPNGSHKDRGISYELSAYISRGHEKFVISSSGNSSISAISLLKDRHEFLYVYLSPNTSAKKLQRIQSALGIEQAIFASDAELRFNNIVIRFTKRAVSDAFKYARDNNAILLRASTSKYGYVGYMTIAYELAEQMPNCTDIFIPTSSGSTAVGIYEGYLRLRSLSKIENLPRIHVCQSTAVNTFAKEFDRDFVHSDTSIANSIVDKVGHRRNQVLKLIEQSKGSGWVISDVEIKDIDKYLYNDTEISSEGKLAIASYLKAIDNGWEIEYPVILITGTEGGVK